MILEISNFYPKTLLKQKKYVRLKLADLPDDFIEHHNLQEKATPKGFVYVTIKQGMYGLPQSDILFQELLEERLEKHRHNQSKFTPGLWTHDWRPICFTLFVKNLELNILESNKLIIWLV